MDEVNHYMDQILEIRHQSPEKERELCLKLLELDKTEYSRAFAHTYLADAFHSMGQLDQAMDECHMAMQLIGEEVSEYEKLSLTLNNLAGVIYIGLDDEQGALDCFFKEMEIAEQLEDYIMCSAALANIAFVYKEAGAYDKAEQTMNRAYQMAKKASDNDTNIAFSGEFYNMLKSGLALEKGEPDKALEYLEALDTLKDDPLDVPLLYASCYAQKGQREAALRELAKSWTEVEKIRNRFEKLSHYFDILDVLMTLKEYGKAEAFAQKAEVLLEKVQSAGKWTRLLDYEIKIYTAQGNEEKLDRAYELFFEYDQIFHKVSRQATVKRLQKRMELQEEADRHENMEAWRDILFKRNEYDELTGVLNRRGIRKHMSAALEEAKKKQEKFTVLIIDVDFFKEFNDTYGHVEGDKCLKRVAEILKEAVSKNGMVGRYGGDEFLITITGGELTDVTQMTARIKGELKNAAILNEKSRVSEFVTVTIGGVHVTPVLSKGFSCYVEKADRVLYGLKKGFKGDFAIAEALQGDENEQGD